MVNRADVREEIVEHGCVVRSLYVSSHLKDLFSNYLYIAKRDYQEQNGNAVITA